MTTNPLATRFRGYYPVVIDVETAGFNYKKDALLEIAAVFLGFDDKQQFLEIKHDLHWHIEPFKSANIDPSAIQFLGLDPNHPFRFAVSEKQALTELNQALKKEIKQAQCSRAILIGHNPTFDLNFMQAAYIRTEIKPLFHQFTTLDTATLGALCYGQTVLAKILHAAQISFDPKQAHSAIYDARKTAELFCDIYKQWEMNQ